jgi:hypothetical protein
MTEQPYGPTPQRRATDHPAVQAQELELRRSSGHRKLLVAAAIAAGIAVVGFAFGRTIDTERRDLELCRDLDRFALGFEGFIEEPGPEVPEDDAQRVRDFRVFLEDFRTDLDCRTDGGP